LDQQTQTEADHYLGAGGAARLADTLANALAHLLSTMPKIWLFGVGFTVVPGVDSFIASQLSAIPIVAWINERTLAAFGYYRASAVGGNIKVKNESDLDLSVSEFRPYDCRQFALLLSAEAFTRLMCPILRDSVIKELMVQRQKDQFHEDITNRYQKEIRDQKIAEHYDEYFWWYLMQANPGLDPTEIASRAAQAEREVPGGDMGWNMAHEYAWGRCQQETDAEIDHRTQIALDNWLMFDAQQAIDAAQPPPCGKGSVDKIKKELNIPGEQRLAELKLKWLGAYPRYEFLRNGTIHVHYEAEAFQEDLWGDIWVPVSGEVVSQLTVNKDASS
jgi:hypothetical protein